MASKQEHLSQMCCKLGDQFRFFGPRVKEVLSGFIKRAEDGMKSKA